MHGGNSSGLSPRRSRPQAPSIAPRSTTKSTCRSAAWPPATSDQGHKFKTVEAEQKCSALSLRNPTCCRGRNGGEGGILRRRFSSMTYADFKGTSVLAYKFYQL